MILICCLDNELIFISILAIMIVISARFNIIEIENNN